LVAELDGKADLEFSRDGLRANFEFSLDSLQPKSELAQTGLRESRKLSGPDPAMMRDKNVLVVEDEYLVAQETADALVSAGCSVTGPVGNLQDALRIAVSEDLDAGVLDINLNGELVWPVARALQARGIPLVFTTGYSHMVQTPPELAHALRIEKPFGRDRLLSSLAATVARGAEI
jgi:CheY-like chemotaxis protein